MTKLICAVTVLAVSTAHAADVSHVDAGNCPGPGSGSEAEPYCSIQTAIDNAVDSDEIIVTPGTYFESINFLGKAITLRSSGGAAVTIIDGTGNFHVVQCVNGEGLNTILDGFTITGGNADGVLPDNRGGGMHNAASSPTVINCVFSGNSAIRGGAMYNITSSPTVTNCTFSGNIAGNGGGMYNITSSPSVTNCTFSGNSADVGGGMINLGNSSPTVTNCTFSGNTAAVVISSSGGGMYTSGSSPTVTNCTFIGNVAVDSGGGMSSDGGSSPIVANCTFGGNIATFGGGMSNNSSSPTVTNCTFSGNLASSGGGMFNDVGSSTTVTNCVLWGDSPGEIAGPETPTVSYSDVQGGWPGLSNIATDPLFADKMSGDLRLLPGSPCIDAGHNWAIAGISDTDLDGNPRFVADPVDFDPGCGIPVVVDMGAYEFQIGSPFPVRFGDIDGDGVVGIIDFLALLTDWGSCVAQCCLADFDLDGNVGITDFLILLEYWE